MRLPWKWQQRRRYLSELSFGDLSVASTKNHPLETMVMMLSGVKFKKVCTPTSSLEPTEVLMIL
jgi:hypothetical protein